MSHLQEANVYINEQALKQCLMRRDGRVISFYPLICAHVARHGMGYTHP